MEYSQEQLEREGYCVQAAPVDDWRVYDVLHPVPGYYQFDWLSSRHPDLYHRFALDSTGMMLELDKLVDLSGLEVIDVGAGTGRSAMGAARRAKTVTAIDVFESVVHYGMDRVRQAGLTNIAYVRGDRNHLPFAENSFDALINSWAELTYPEAYRVLKPGGYIIRLGAPLEALCGELTATLADVNPSIVSVAPGEWFEAGFPEINIQIEVDLWNGLPVIPPILQHDFTHIADYGGCQEAAAIMGRLFGPKAKQYFLERGQSHFARRLRIEVGRVRK